MGELRSSPCFVHNDSVKDAALSTTTKGKQNEKKGFKNFHRRRRYRYRKRKNNTTGENEDDRPTQVAPVHTVSLRCDWKDGYMSRVVVTNWKSQVVFDKTVRSKNFHQQLASVLENKVIVGHGLEHCLQGLNLLHKLAWTDVRDCAYYHAFMRQSSLADEGFLECRMLEDLAFEFLKRDVWNVHDPLLQQARAAMDLYRLIRCTWEAELAQLVYQECEPVEATCKEWIPRNALANPEGADTADEPCEATESQDDGQSILAPSQASIPDSDPFLHGDVCSNLSDKCGSIWKPPSLDRTATGSSSSSWGLWLPPMEDPLPCQTIDTEGFPELQLDLLPQRLLDECAEEAERVKHTLL